MLIYLFVIADLNSTTSGSGSGSGSDGSIVCEDEDDSVEKFCPHQETFL